MSNEELEEKSENSVKAFSSKLVPQDYFICEDVDLFQIN